MPVRPTSQFPTLRPLQVPATLAVPVARAASIKPVGTRVARGESLLIDPSELGAIALAPATGTIVEHASVDVLPLMHHHAAVIRTEPDAENSAAQSPATIESSSAIARPDELGGWIDRIRNAGIWAHRTDCPDLLGQLQQLLKRPCDTVICSALDNEAGVQLNATLAATFGSEIRAAMQLLSSATGARRSLFITSYSDRPRASGRTNLARWKKIGVRVMSVRNVYPQSDPTLLIHTLLKRRLRPGRLPTELGVLLLDAPAAVAIGRLILNAQPMLDVPLVICDVPGGRTHHLIVPIGASVRQVLDSLAMQSDGLPLRAGDSLRHLTASADAVIAGGETVLHVGYADPTANPDPCIRCGWCVQACPTRVQPAAVFEAAQNLDLSRAELFGVHACIECGICTYVCPARLPLMETIRGLRHRRSS